MEGWTGIQHVWLTATYPQHSARNGLKLTGPGGELVGGLQASGGDVQADGGEKGRQGGVTGAAGFGETLGRLAALLVGQVHGGSDVQDLLYL
jgi:hypothetical protein